MCGWEQGKRNAIDKKVADDTSIILTLPSALLLADTTSLLMRAWCPDTALLLLLLLLLPRLPLLLMVLMTGAEAEVTPPLQPSPPPAPPCCLSARSCVILNIGGEMRTPETHSFLTWTSCIFSG